MKQDTADKIVIALFFASAYFSMNLSINNISNYLIGIAFTIAASYGVIQVTKKQNFLFS